MARRHESAPTGDEQGDLDDLSYRDAVDELEQILTELEDDTVDIDQLSRRVRRAAGLIRLCQDRIAGARLEVEQVVADLAAVTDLAAAGAGSVPVGSDDDLDEVDGALGDDDPD